MSNCVTTLRDSRFLCFLVSVPISLMLQSSWISPLILLILVCFIYLFIYLFFSISSWSLCCSRFLAWWIQKSIDSSLSVAEIDTNCLLTWADRISQDLNNKKLSNGFLPIGLFVRLELVWQFQIVTWILTVYLLFYLMMNENWTVLYVVVSSIVLVCVFYEFSKICWAKPIIYSFCVCSTSTVILLLQNCLPIIKLKTRNYNDLVQSMSFNAHYNNSIKFALAWLISWLIM